MNNMINNAKVSVYVDGNDVMFVFSDTTEEQKVQLLAFANELCNINVKTFTSLAEKESVPETAPDPTKMEQVATSVPTAKTETKVEAAVETESTVQANVNNSVYEMDKDAAIAYLVTNIDNGVFVGYENLIRAYFIAKGMQDKLKAKEAVFAKDTFAARTMFEKNFGRIQEFVNEHKPEPEDEIWA